MNCLVLMIYPVPRNDLRLGKKYEMPITFLMAALVNFFTTRVEESRIIYSVQY